jgi:hypothetical protein
MLDYTIVYEVNNGNHRNHKLFKNRTKAEKFFAELVKANTTATPEEITLALDEGYWEYDNGYEAYIVRPEEG